MRTHQIEIGQVWFEPTNGNKIIITEIDKSPNETGEWKVYYTTINGYRDWHFANIIDSHLELVSD